MNKQMALLTLLGLLIAGPALALDLQAARTSGQVGEKTDGYVQALNPSAEVNALVAEVNTRRQQEYARISKEKNQPIDVVAKLAAAQIINQLPAGSSYQSPGGGWQKR